MWNLIQVGKNDGAREYSQSHKLQNLLHEIMHAADWQTAHKMFDDENDRKMDSIVGLLLQAILSNPAIPRALLEESERKTEERENRNSPERMHTMYEIVQVYPKATVFCPDSQTEQDMNACAGCEFCGEFKVNSGHGTLPQIYLECHIRRG